MSPTQELADLAAELKKIADARMDLTVAGVSAAWADAWGSVAGDWRIAIDDLINLADEDGNWPARKLINRASSAQAALQATVQALQAAVSGTDAAAVADLAGLVQLAAEQQTQMLAAQMPPDWAPPVTGFDSGAVQAMVQRSSAQITALTWPLSRDAEAAIRHELVRGMAVGDNPRQTASRMLARVEGAFNGGRARAENIARTESVDILRTASQQMQDANSDVLRGWRWTAELDGRECVACIAMHGREFPLSEPGPLDHQSGRCARTPLTRTWRELGFDLDEPEGLTPPTGLEWFEDQPEAIQKKILGPLRFKAWKAGEYPPERWAVLKSNPEWRSSYIVGPLNRTGGAR